MAELFDRNDEDRLTLPPRMLVLIEDMRTQWRELDRRIGAFEEEFIARARDNEAALRLITIPGMGVMNATALVALRTSLRVSPGLFCGMETRSMAEQCRLQLDHDRPELI